MKKRSGFGRRLVVILTAAVMMLSAAAEEAPELLEPVGVEMDTATAVIGDFEKLTAYHGMVAAHMEELYFTSGGVIDEVCVIIGQTVREGDALATLDQESRMERLEALREDLEQMEINAEYEDALAEVDLQLLELDLEELMLNSPGDETAIALKRLEIEEFELNCVEREDLRRLSRTRLEEEIRLLETQIGESVLRAPCDGRIVYIAGIEPTSYVSAYTTVMVIADDSRLTIETDMISGMELNNAEEIYALIGSQRYAVEALPIDMGEYYARAMAGETLKSEFALLEPCEGLTAGTYAAVVVVNTTRESVLLLPYNALYGDEESDYVYVIENGVRVRRNVETGMSNGYQIEIRSGIAEGEVVYVQE